MNAETQRITRLGGKIVRIRPASDYSSGTKGVVGTVGGNRQKLYRVRVTKSSLARTAKVRASISEYLIPYEQLSSALKRFNQKGSKVLNVSPA
ncbi:phycobilisome linker polypeptide [Acaryochloris marina]|nr:phycobilisome linker polypeptide [Acaryochloris marina]